MAGGIKLEVNNENLRFPHHISDHLRVTAFIFLFDKQTELVKTTQYESSYMIQL